MYVMVNAQSPCCCCEYMRTLMSVSNMTLKITFQIWKVISLMLTSAECVRRRTERERRIAGARHAHAHLRRARARPLHPNARAPIPHSRPQRGQTADDRAARERSMHPEAYKTVT